MVNSLKQTSKLREASVSLAQNNFPEGFRNLFVEDVGWGNIFFLDTWNKAENYTYNKFPFPYVWVLLAISRYNFKITVGVGSKSEEKI